MRGRRLEIILLILIVACAAIVLASCSKISAVESIEMKDATQIDVPMGEFSYDGKAIVVYFANGTKEEVALTEDMIPERERLKFFKYGEQEVKVVYDSRYTTTMKINVVRKTFEDIYELEGYSCVYDGRVHMVHLNKELPEGATADFIYGNAFTNVGEYDVVCVLSKEGLESKTLRTKLIIEPARHSEEEIKFEDATVTYNGTAMGIVAQNVPEGVEVSYAIYNDESSIKINSAIKAGRYRFVAHFTDANENYEPIADRVAYLTIQKAELDMSGVSLTDRNKTYDGQSYTPTFDLGSVVPEGLLVTFKCKDKDGAVVQSCVDAGTYTIVASFDFKKAEDENNYLPIEDMTATLTVNKRVIEIEDIITFDSETISFDRAVHSLAIQGTLPDSVEVSYENNNQIYAGEYEIFANFSAKNANETVDVEQMSAYLIINKVKEHITYMDSVTNEDFIFTYEAGIRTGLEIDGLDTETYAISYWTIYKPDETPLANNEEFKEGVIYNYEIVFRFVDDNVNDSVILSSARGTYTYVPPTI